MLQSHDRKVEIRRCAFTFRGNAREYFGIWIANVILTLLTAGIYSAWAKVRRQRYFYGNTVVDGHAFEYHARPIAILAGRLVAVAAIVVVAGVGVLMPYGEFLLLPLFALGLPFVIQRGTRFNARVTSYRNVRFDFVGTYLGAMKAYVLGYILGFFSFGLLTPVTSRWAARYIVDNARYGDRPFASNLRLSAFFQAFFIAAWLPIAAFMLLVIILPSLDSATALGSSLYRVLPLAIILFYVTIGVSYLVYSAATRNIVYNGAVLDGRHAFVSTISLARFAWIAVSNLVVTIATLGLMRPWAAVRMAKYLAGATAVDSQGNFDSYASDTRAVSGVASAEYMDVEGFDLGFGF